MYEYRASVTRVVDGDTVYLDVDLGFEVRFSIKTRLHGINSPEMNTAAGKAARAHLVSLLPDGCEVLVRTFKDRQGKYGRYLVQIFTADAVSVNQRMLADGHAVEYMA